MENNLIFFTTQWFTIQPDLFGRIEDEVGEIARGRVIGGGGPPLPPESRKRAEP